MTFLVAVDDVRRFPTSRKLVGYSGLAPTVRQSGERTEYGSISREGRRELRAVWVQISYQITVVTRNAANIPPTPPVAIDHITWGGGYSAIGPIVKKGDPGP